MKDIVIEDRIKFDQYFSKFHPKISEYTFTNLFIWRNYYKFKWTEMEEHLILQSMSDKNIIKLFPIIGKKPHLIIKKLSQIAREANKILEIHRCSEDYVKNIVQSNIFDNLDVINDRNNWDYVYSIDDLLTLPGKKHRSNRAKLNKFTKRYNWKPYKLDKHVIDECLILQDNWCYKHCCDEDLSLELEDRAIRDAFKHYDQLGYEGTIIRIDGKIEAFTLGESLNDQNFVVHIEKANIEFVGAYQAINYQFAKQIEKKVKFINREQDVGEPGLRTAKLRYCPSYFIKKSIIRISP